MPQLTPEQRKEIVKLRKANARICDISRKVGVTKGTIYKWVQRYAAKGSTERYRSEQYARATTSAQDALIIKAHSRNPFRPISVTAREYAISTETVRRRLQKAGLRYFLSTSKTSLEKDSGPSSSENSGLLPSESITEPAKKNSRPAPLSAEADDSGTENELDGHLRYEDSSDEDGYLTSSPKHTKGVVPDNSDMENELVQRLRYDDSSDEDSRQGFPTKQTDKESDKSSHCNSCNNTICGFRYICVQCTDVELCASCEAREVHGLHYVLRVPGRRPKEEIASMLKKIREILECGKGVESEKSAVEEQPDPVVVVEESDPLGVAAGLDLVVAEDPYLMAVEEELDLVMSVEEDAVCSTATGASQVTTNDRTRTEMPVFSDSDCQSSDSDLFAYSKSVTPNTHLDVVPSIKNTNVDDDVLEICDGGKLVFNFMNKPTDISHVPKQHSTIVARERLQRTAGSAHSTALVVGTAANIRLEANTARSTVSTARSLLKTRVTTTSAPMKVPAARSELRKSPEAGVALSTGPAARSLLRTSLAESARLNTMSAARSLLRTSVTAKAAPSTVPVARSLLRARLEASVAPSTVPASRSLLMTNLARGSGPPRELHSTWAAEGAAKSTGTIAGFVHNSKHTGGTTARSTVSAVHPVNSLWPPKGTAPSICTIAGTVNSTSPGTSPTLSAVSAPVPVNSTWLALGAVPTTGTMGGTVNSTRLSSNATRSNLPASVALHSTETAAASVSSTGPQLCASLTGVSVLPGTYFLQVTGLFGS